MTNCDKCDFPLPTGAEYCPNCGSPAKRIPQISIPSRSTWKVLQAGLLGAFLSVTITSLVPLGIETYFLPSFISSLAAMYLFRTRKLDETIMISFATYLFADAIFGGLVFGTIYFENIPLAQAYGNYMLTLLDVILYIANPITAILAGYIGFRLTSKPEKREQQRFSYGRGDESRGSVIYSLSQKN